MKSHTPNFRSDDEVELKNENLKAKRGEGEAIGRGEREAIGILYSSSYSCQPWVTRENTLVFFIFMQVWK